MRLRRFFRIYPALHVLGWLIGSKVEVDYTSYIKSDAWRKKAKKARAKAGHRCQRCGKKGYLEVHHKTYKRLGREWFRDLEVLCARCHMAKHRNRRIDETKRV